MSSEAGSGRTRAVQDVAFSDDRTQYGTRGTESTCYRDMATRDSDYRTDPIQRQESRG